MQTSHSDDDAPRICRACGQTRPASEYYRSKPHVCKECLRARGRAWRARNPERVRALKARYNRKIRGEPVRVRSRSDTPLPSERLPLPSLRVGMCYRITDGSTDTYSGPCVARWGGNWGIKTSTGIRCFTQGQLVGMRIQEVERIA